MAKNYSNVAIVIAIVAIVTFLVNIVLFFGVMSKISTSYSGCTAIPRCAEAMNSIWIPVGIHILAIILLLNSILYLRGKRVKLGGILMIIAGLFGLASSGGIAGVLSIIGGIFSWISRE